MKKLIALFMALSFLLFFNLPSSMAGADSDDINIVTQNIIPKKATLISPKSSFELKLDIYDTHVYHKDQTGKKHWHLRTPIETTEFSFSNLSGEFLGGTRPNYRYSQRATIRKGTDGSTRTIFSFGSYLPYRKGDITLTYRYMNNDNLLWGNCKKHGFGLRHQYFTSGLLKSISNYVYTGWTSVVSLNNVFAYDIHCDRKYEYGLTLCFGQDLGKQSKWVSAYRVIVGTGFEKLQDNRQDGKSSGQGLFSSLFATTRTCIGDLQVDWRQSELINMINISNTVGPLKFYFQKRYNDFIEDRRIGFQIQTDFSKAVTFFSNISLNLEQFKPLFFEYDKYGYHDSKQIRHIKTMKDDWI